MPLLLPSPALAGFVQRPVADRFTVDGNGAAFFDMDGDGCLDVLLTDDARTGTPRNVGIWIQRMEQETCTGDFGAANAPTLDFSGHEHAGRSVVVADFDDDGDPDIAHNSSLGFRIERNDGEGGFSTLFDQGRDTPGGLNSEFVCWLDLDGDGDLDLLFDNQQFGIGAWIQAGDGNGIDDSPYLRAEVLAAGGEGLYSDYGACADIDGDGRVDFHIRRAGVDGDARTADTWLNRHPGNGRPVDASAFLPLTAADFDSDNTHKGGASFCDLDGDGDLDLLRTDFGGNVILRNDGAAGFADITPPSLRQDMEPGVNRADDIGCLDVDNDGDLDVLLSTNQGGHRLLLNQPGPEPGSQALVLQSELPFDARTAGDGEGMAFGDYDRDGDVDVLIQVRDHHHAYLIANDQDDRDYLMVELLSGSGRRAAIGATARLRDCAGNPVSGLREVTGGRGHGSQDAPLLHFGLGRLASPGKPEPGVVVVESRFPRSARIAGAAESAATGRTVQVAVAPARLDGYRLLRVHETDRDDLAACQEQL